MVLFGRTRVKTNMAEVSADSSGDSKVLTELDNNKVKVIERSRGENINLREEDVLRAIFSRKMPEECTVKQQTATAMAPLSWS